MSSIHNQHAGQSQEITSNYFMHEQEIIVDGSIEPYCSSLCSMFPNVDPEYIRQICLNPPFDSNEEDRLEMLVNHLLSYGDQLDTFEVDENYETLNSIPISDSEAKINDEILTKIIQEDFQMMEIEKQNEERTDDVLFSEFLKNEVIDEKMNLLENLLPDADPEFLRQFVQDNYENAMSMEQFVESCIINQNYQKRDKYYAKIKKQEKIKRYTIGFTVEEFVKEFPEPFEYFENVEKSGKFQEQAFNFLKIRYSNHPEHYLKYMYLANNYNLSCTDRQIKSITACDDPIMLLNFEVDNTALLQEIAFIQNKPFIKLYLDHMKSEEEKELQELRAKKLLLECQCCYDELKPTDCVECDNNHIFCRRCIIKGTNLVILNGQVSVKCLVECNQEINLNVLRKVLPEYTFEMLLNKRQESEVEAAQLEGLVICPFCPYQMELGPQIKIFTCKNPECMKITCRLCRKMNHLPIRCEDVVNEHKGRLYIEEEMSKALIRNCHRCQKPFVKSIGCNKMTCPCGAVMCYICRLPYRSDISHRNCNGNSLDFDQQQVNLSRARAIAKLHNDFQT